MKTLKLLLIVLLYICCCQPLSFTQNLRIPVIDSIITRIKVDSIVRVVRELSGDTTCIIGGNQYTLTTRAGNYPGNDLAAQYIYERFQSYGLQVSYWQYNSTGKNVIAQKTGIKYPNKKYIIGAHYDSYPFELIAPGADDDASGVAVVLEAAKQLSHYNFDYTLMFIAWDEEEFGMFGSHAYADSAFARGDSIICYINLDMVGYDLQNLRNIDICTNSNSFLMAQFYNSVANTYFPDMNPQTTIINWANSDHYYFWQNGYKSIWPFELPENPHVNKITDSIKWFNYKYFVEMTQVAVASFAMLGLNYDLSFEHNPLASDTTTLNRIAKAVIRCGQPLATGPNAPKLYYKAGSDFYTPVEYFYKNADTFKFTIPGQPEGTIVSYYFAVQDSSGTIAATYPTGGGGIDPPGSIPPDYPLRYTVLDYQISCSNTVPVEILPMQMVYDTIEIKDNRVVYDLDVNLTVNFPVDSMIIITLINPEGRMIPLSSRNGGSGSNYINTTFDDSASISIKNGTAPFTGTFKPEGSLGYCTDNPVAGKWKLRVYNFSNALSGQIVSWCLNAELYNPIGIARNQIPVKTNLSQNYPNPFNPSTTIKFTLERQSDIKLIVYDILGREAGQIATGRMQGGEYNMKFDGSRLSSGIYFYTLYLDGIRYDTKKMVLIK